jgi:hypothetical protein
LIKSLLHYAGFNDGVELIGVDFDDAIHPADV